MGAPIIKFRRLTGEKLLNYEGQIIRVRNFLWGTNYQAWGTNYHWEGWRRFGGASGSVLFQYIGVGREQFYQYIVSMLEYSCRSFGGYWEEWVVMGGEEEIGYLYE